MGVWWSTWIFVYKLSRTVRETIDSIAVEVKGDGPPAHAKSIRVNYLEYRIAMNKLNP